MNGNAYCLLVPSDKTLKLLSAIVNKILSQYVYKYKIVIDVHTRYSEIILLVVAFKLSLAFLRTKNYYAVTDEN